jgi:hypothetical protein
VSEQEVDDLMAAIRRSLAPSQYPHTAVVMEALAAIFVGSNGLQVDGCPQNPSVAAIKRYLDDKGMMSLSEDEIRNCLRVLRRRAKTVLEECGWEIEHPFSKYV